MKIILCRGIQGSGKSTWSRSWVSEDPEHRVRFNNDEVRLMLGGGPKGYWVPSREEVVYEMKKSFIYRSMWLGVDIVIDNMNLSSSEINFYKRIVDNHNNPKGVIPDIVLEKYEIIFRDFYVPLEECIRRDSLRSNPIGEKVIRDTYEKYKDTIENDLYRGEYGK